MFKRGVAKRYITLIIMALVGLVILLFGTVGIAQVINQGGDKAACQQWVDLHSEKILGNSFPAGSDDNPCITQEATTKSNEPEVVYEEVARDAYECLDSYRWGEKDFYSDWEGWKLVDREERPLYCLVCMDRTFKEPFEFKGQDFVNYLSTHEIPQVVGRSNQKQTYLEKFLGNEKVENLDLGGNAGTVSLGQNDDSHFYMALMIQKKPKDLNFETFKNLGGKIAIPGGVGVAAVVVGIIASGPIAIAGGIGIMGVGAYSGHFLFANTEYFPSLMWGNAEDLKEECHSSMHFKPKKKFFSKETLFGDDDA
tara:strand:+ start:223 stop:1152 length:930 start_codon:yes stop_codon:yes gene_type:complete